LTHKSSRTARDLIPGDKTIKAIKPGDPRERLNDGDGLSLLLFVKGGAHGWRYAYSLNGRRNILSLGTYPDTGLALARKKADDARAQVGAGIDPSIARNHWRSCRAASRGRPLRFGPSARGRGHGLEREWVRRVEGWTADQRAFCSPPCLPAPNYRPASGLRRLLATVQS